MDGPPQEPQTQDGGHVSWSLGTMKWTTRGPFGPSPGLLRVVLVRDDRSQSVPVKRRRQ